MHPLTLGNWAVADGCMRSGRGIHHNLPSPVSGELGGLSSSTPHPREKKKKKKDVSRLLSIKYSGRCSFGPRLSLISKPGAIDTNSVISTASHRGRYRFTKPEL